VATTIAEKDSHCSRRNLIRNREVQFPIVIKVSHDDR